MLKKFPILIFIVFNSISLNLQADWRKDGSAEEQLSNLVELVPGTAHWMNEMGERYKNLYWAAKQEKWEFANYQVEEIDKLTKIVILARPKRAKTAQEFLDSAIPELTKAMEEPSWDSFEQSFMKLQQACMICHVQNDHGFIVIPLVPASASSPVLNMK